MQKKQGMIVMDDSMMREVVARNVATRHGNPEFIRQLAEGEQDDGPFMQGARAVRDWFVEQLQPVEEPFEE